MARLLLQVKAVLQYLAKIYSRRNRQTLQTNRQAENRIPTLHFQSTTPVRPEQLRATQQRKCTTRSPMQAKAIPKR